MQKLRAKNYDYAKHGALTYVQPKLDGQRCWIKSRSDSRAVNGDMCLVIDDNVSESITNMFSNSNPFICLNVL